MPQRPPHHSHPRPKAQHEPSRRPNDLDDEPLSQVSSHPPDIILDRLDGDALKVVYRLRHLKHQAYFVGGCVRDALLGRTPKDFDLATSAHPGEVRAAFRNCRLIGRRFRLAHVYFHSGKVIEVATFRANPTDLLEDVPESGGDLLITRDNVFGTAEQDARRRDFTVNGLFYDVFAGEVIDYVGGREDLEARRISTIGDPEIRMREDPVRALRAIRFAARLGFSIEPDTFAAMKRHAGELARCAPARILEEVFKILRCGASARAFELLRTIGAMPLLLPGLLQIIESRGANWEALISGLAKLDRLCEDGATVSDAVLLGALLLPFLDSSPQSVDSADDEPANERHDPTQAIAPILQELVRTARLPRKIAERTRLALQAQRHLEHPEGGKRKKRGRNVLGQTYFVDALQIFELVVKSRGQGQDVLDHWKARLAERGSDHRDDSDSEEAEPKVAEAGAAPAVAVEGGGPKRRRRSRGGRRRRKRGGPPSHPGAT